MGNPMNASNTHVHEAIANRGIILIASKKDMSANNKALLIRISIIILAAVVAYHIVAATDVYFSIEYGKGMVRSFSIFGDTGGKITVPILLLNAIVQIVLLVITSLAVSWGLFKSNFKKAYQIAGALLIWAVLFSIFTYPIFYTFVRE